MRSPRRGLPVAGLALAVLATLAAGSPRPSVEYQVKASYLFNFFRFVHWPADPALPADRFVLGVVGPDRLGAALERIDGKLVRGRPVEVRRFADPREVVGCHVLFVTLSSESAERALLERLREHPVLTVGESRSFLDHGGSIRLHVVDKRVRLELDPSTANRGGMRLGAELLQIGSRR